MAQKRDYYEVLGVSQDATANDIKQAYRRLARQHHPDVNPGDSEAEERFKEIGEAYEVLSNPQKRAAYDQFGHAGVGAGGGGYEGGFDFSQGYGGGGLGDIFDMFFGSGGFGRQESTYERQPTAERGADLRYDLEMTLEEVATGLEKEIKVSRLETCELCDGSGAAPGSKPETCSVCHGAGQVRQQTQTFFGTSVRIGVCPRCHGEGKIISNPCGACGGQGRVRKASKKTVKIPAGVDNGTRIRMTGEGDAGVRGGPAGDLYIITFVREHEIFERRGNDIWAEVPVSFVQASLGATIEVPVLDGKDTISINDGTQTGDIYTLKGKGIPEIRGRGVGDEKVVIRVETPTHLNEEQKKLLEQFAKLRGEDVVPPKDKSIFERVKDVLGGR
jgi:molecular chaperone DnaJ